MNENEIVAGPARLKTLRDADDDRHLARKVLQRDRGRVRLLTGLAILFWAIAGAGVLFVTYVAIFHVYPKQQKLMHDHASGNLPTEQVIEIQALHFRVMELCTLVVVASFIAATLAAACTILLVFVSRRATLKQVNATLVEIFELLHQQRSAPVQAASRPTQMNQE